MCKKVNKDKDKNASFGLQTDKKHKRKYLRLN